jgi:NTP pyrophosphatase (non-canonical NTP hydrolase)
MTPKRKDGKMDLVKLFFERTKHLLAVGFRPDRYQLNARRTWKVVSPGLDFLHAAMGLSGESGELLDKLKKQFFKDGYVLTRNDFIEELGDVFYYLARLADMVGVTIDELATLNRAKLKGGKHGWEENE